MGVGDWEGNLVTSWCLHCGRLWCALELLGADGCGRGSPGLGSGFWAPGLGAGAHLSVARGFRQDTTGASGTGAQGGRDMEDNPQNHYQTDKGETSWAS